MHKAAGAFGGIRIWSRPQIPVPFPSPLELGFAISYPLAVALEKIQDKCLQRYTLHSLGLMIGSKLLWKSLVSLSFVTLAFTRLITLYHAFIGSEIPKIPTQCSTVPSLCHQIPMEGMEEV
ncbi:hypothetical protein JHK82_050082 [Glycine max]|nr:hypothetical protein JHK82_050082 [Glycine max]